ncbi:GntR family transcriptional regulator [Bacteroidota bacterium]
MDNYQTIDISIVSNSGETKLQQLTNELLRVINTQYKEGEGLPSVNVLSKDLEVSRDTVFKAYCELKRRKIVDSTPTKGYFVSRDIKKVLLILDYYSPFKDVVYREVENNLDDSYSIDLVFHHYNKKLFESVILESAGRYNAYIVMNFDTKNLEISNILKKIDSSKLQLCLAGF